MKTLYASTVKYKNDCSTMEESVETPDLRACYNIILCTAYYN